MKENERLNRIHEEWIDSENVFNNIKNMLQQEIEDIIKPMLDLIKHHEYVSLPHWVEETSFYHFYGHSKINYFKTECHRLDGRFIVCCHKDEIEEKIYPLLYIPFNKTLDDLKEHYIEISNTFIEDVGKVRTLCEPTIEGSIPKERIREAVREVVNVRLKK